MIKSFKTHTGVIFCDTDKTMEYLYVGDYGKENNIFKEKYDNPHDYAMPYDVLYCGKLQVEELPTTYNEKDFWWWINETDKEE